MILSCPACNTRFQFDESLLRDGSRKVRCGKCSHVWQCGAADLATTEEIPAEQLRVEVLSTPDRDSESVVEGRRRPAKKSPEERGESSLLVGWALLLVFIVGLLGGLWAFRDSVVAAVPGMARLYELVEGRQVIPGEGLAIQNVSSRRRLIDGDRAVFIEGEVLNFSDIVRQVPSIRISINDADGREVSFWHVTPSAMALEPGESLRFETSKRDLPPNGSELDMKFEQPPN